MELVIRSYKQSDLEALLKSGYPSHVDKTIYERLNRRLISNENRLIGLMGNQIVGTLTLKKCLYDLWEIRYVYTVPCYRQLGIANNLLSSTFSYLSQLHASKVILDVLCDNLPAEKTYKKFGFKKIIPFFWGEGPVVNINCQEAVSLQPSCKEDFDCVYRSLVDKTFETFFGNNQESSWLNFVNRFFIDRFDSSFFAKPIKQIFSKTVFLVGKKEGKVIGLVMIKLSFNKKASPLLIVFVSDKSEAEISDLLIISAEKILFKKGYRRAKLLVFDQNIEYYENSLRSLKNRGWKILLQYCMGTTVIPR
jgi:GNAT superfamily N-acetyltransferase